MPPASDPTFLKDGSGSNLIRNMDSDHFARIQIRNHDSYLICVVGPELYDELRGDREAAGADPRALHQEPCGSQYDFH